MTDAHDGLKELKMLHRAGDLAGAMEHLITLASATDDSHEFLALARWRKRLRSDGARFDPDGRKTVRVAVLGGATTDFLEQPLALSLEVLGLDPVLHSSDYNTFAQEMLDPSSATVDFEPDVAVVAATPANIPAWPSSSDDAEAVKERVSEVVDHWLGLCQSLHDRTGCEIVLNNFHRSTTRPMGNLAAKTPWDPNNFILRVNLELGARAPGYVHINDVEGLASSYGLRSWFDSRYWFHAKQPVSFECLLPYVRNTARIIGALFGLTAKCLVLDLDNTLWGGVIGDDGPEGIRLGQGDPVGEAHQAFQEYVLRLKERGVILAVCSKNDEAQALRGFEEHADMVLKRDDFAAFRANWDPKPDNLMSIAQELNIGLDSLVFVDDNPAEREHVRQLLPEVQVIELTDDPADYPRLLDDATPFEMTALSAEDLDRTRQYQANAQRAQAMDAAADYGAYLASLEQQGVVRAFDVQHLDRITQLINKTNQFNLTTERLSRSQVEELMEGDGVTAYVRIRDRFGDNGLISVASARKDGMDYHIHIWLMSCRVLKRDVEKLLCNYLVEEVKKRGGRRLFGVYKPTERNGMVERLYETLGFELVEEEPDGSTRWCLDVNDYTPFDVPIDIEEEALV